MVDEYTRECLAIRVARRLTSEDVLQQLTELFVARGTLACLRSDNGPELTATAVREWLARVGVTPLFIGPGSPWENGYIESFNGKLRDELLDRELFYTLAEAQILPERCRNWYDNRGRVRSRPDGRVRVSSSPACRPASRRTWRRGKRRHGRHHRTDDARLRRMRGVDRLDGTGLEKGR